MPEIPSALSVIPELPDIKDAEQNIDHPGDHRPVLFEYYRYAGLMANFAARIERESRSANPIGEVEWTVLRGLLNRVSKLVLVNVKLSHDGYSGEGTTIIDRSIFESACKALWLMNGKNGDEFQKYLADGLKQEIEFSEYVKSTAQTERRQLTEFEQRLVSRVDNTVATSKLSHDQVKATRKIDNLKAITESIGLNDLTYMVAMKLGSHAVHGTWPALLSHYLQRDEDGIFRARDADCETGDIQYVSITQITLNTLKRWCDWALSPSPERKLFMQRLDYAKALSWECYKKSVDNRDGQSFRDRFQKTPDN